MVTMVWTTTGNGKRVMPSQPPRACNMRACVGAAVGAAARQESVVMSNSVTGQEGEGHS